MGIKRMWFLKNSQTKKDEKPTEEVNQSYASGQKPTVRQELYANEKNLNPALSAQKRRDSLFGN